MIQVKTSAKCAGCVAKIAEQLNTFLTPEQWSIDLSSPDKLLTVKADVPAEKVVEAVRAAGFKAELLDRDRTDEYEIIVYAIPNGVGFCGFGTSLPRR